MNFFDMMKPGDMDPARLSRESAATKLNEAFERQHDELSSAAKAGGIAAAALTLHLHRMREDHPTRSRDMLEQIKELANVFQKDFESGALSRHWGEYWRDATERTVLTLDALRKRGDTFLSHEAGGCPPVLHYSYEKIMDGAESPYPCNYFLLKILPPEGVETDPAKRPFVIIDPRAGHGPGIGGFKPDSQVGVALRAGHAVYFIAFRRAPEPGQFLSYITRAEADFVREVKRRHPNAPAPMVTGNCQGGWATLLLTATNPDLTGPVVINGAPVATWAGAVGDNPMRYNAGVFGGAWVPMFLSDLGGGLFDGAHLVQNFEMLNPSRTMFRKYADLFHDIDGGDERFLDFEKWWSGFFLMTEAEIRWIVEQLFVGNRVVKNEARIEPGRHVDLKSIRAPIIVFASHGDNITPPQQALNWIVETYADVAEIRIRGQRIIYMVHDQVGHLGIFVSSQIARREHSEVNSTLDTIESLAPGLYEMTIEDFHGDIGERRFTVDFKERTFGDIRKLDDGVEDEHPFAAVARWSELQAQAYDMAVRPFVRAAVTPLAAELGRAFHPQRLSRALMSSQNPATAWIPFTAEGIRAEREPVSKNNPLLAAEAILIRSIELGIDVWRDTRDMATEAVFHSVWNNSFARAFGRTHEARRTLKNPTELRALPEVQAVLARIEQGGFVEAAIRMLILLAENRGAVRRDRLERSRDVLQANEPFSSLSPERRSLIIHEQGLIASYEPERAIETLPLLLPTPDERRLACLVVRYVPGPIAEMSSRTLDLIQRFHATLGLPQVTEDVLENPLASSSVRDAAE